MSAPRIGNIQLDVYLMNNFSRQEPFQNWVNLYWNIVKEQADPIQSLVKFINQKSSYYSYKLASDSNIQNATNYLSAGNFEKLYSHMIGCLENDPHNIEYFKLLGIAFAQLREPTRAREQFLNVLKVTPYDRITLANYISACFQDRDGNSGIDAILHHLDLFSDKELNHIAESLTEAIANNVIDYDKLPKKLKDVFVFK